MIIVRQKKFSELRTGQKRFLLCGDPKTGEKYEIVETWNGEKWVVGKRLNRSNSATFRDADDFANAVMAEFKRKNRTEILYKERRKRDLISPAIGAAGIGGSVLAANLVAKNNATRGRGKLDPGYIIKDNKRTLRAAKEILAEVEENRNPGLAGYDRVRYTSGYGYPMYIKNCGEGQVERGEMALARLDKAKRSGNKKAIKKELGKAEKCGKKAVEYLEKEIAANKRAIKKGAVAGSIGLGITAAGTITAHKIYKNKRNRDN